MLYLNFTREYTDCYVGVLKIETPTRSITVCHVFMRKKYPPCHGGVPYRLEGLFKLHYLFEDGYYTPCIISFRRRIPFFLLPPDNQGYEPTYAGTALYVFSERGAIPKNAWSDRVRELQGGGNVNVTCRWDECTYVDEPYFKRKLKEENDEPSDGDEWF